MRKISEMYQQSGGTSYKNKCRECQFFCRIQGNRKEMYRCGKYPDPQALWNTEFIACKFFEEKGKRSRKESKDNSEIGMIQEANMATDEKIVKAEKKQFAASDPKARTKSGRIKKATKQTQKRKKEKPDKNTIDKDTGQLNFFDMHLL